VLSYKNSVVGLILLACLALAKPAPAVDDPELNRAIALYNAKQYNAAIPVLQKILLRPSDPSPTPVYYAGLCYHQLGNISMAQRCYKLLVDDFPGTPEAQRARGALAQMKPHGGTGSTSHLNSTTIAAPGAAPPGASENSHSDAEAYVGRQSPTQFMRNFTMSDQEWLRTPDEVKVPFKRHTSSHLYVNGRVNNRPIEMMFDTGAEQCHFSKRQMDQLGIKADPNSPRIPVQGVGGQMWTSMVMADVSIGDLTRRIPILIDEGDVGMPIVGETFFKEFRYDVDNQGGFIRFTKKPRAGMTARSFESTDVVAVPYKEMGDNMVVVAKVNGQQCPMIFDTGSFAICFSMLHARDLGIRIPSDAQMMITQGAGGKVGSYVFRTDRIELGPIIKTNVEIVVNNSTTPILPLLGQPFYKDRRFSIDPDKHLIKFAH
jgi:clan AA aspartic protease (TIGR02281 family)